MAITVVSQYEERNKKGSAIIYFGLGTLTLIPVVDYFPIRARPVICHVLFFT